MVIIHTTLLKFALPETNPASFERLMAIVSVGLMFWYRGRFVAFVVARSHLEVKWSDVTAHAHVRE